jgi:hypothetical protein
MLGASTNHGHRRTLMFASDPGVVIAQFVFSVVDAAALTTLVFFRKDFGERFLTVFKYGLGIAILTFLLALRAIASTLLGGLAMLMGGPLIGMMAGGMLQNQAAVRAAHHGLFDAANLLYWGFVLVGGYQLATVLYHSYFPGDRVPTHSKSTGTPLLSFGNRVNHALTTIFIEPLAVLFLGELLTLCDPQLPYAYFICVALLLQASAVHQWRLARDEQLDEQDARILSGFYARSTDAKHVMAGGGAVSQLRAFLVSLMLRRKPALPMEQMRLWTASHRGALPGTPAPTAPSSGTSTTTEEPPPPPPQAA